jgi:UDP-N-acetylglucosamine 2-epimerase (non-hydrolysing)
MSQLAVVVGGRPDLVRVASLVRSARRRGRSCILVDAGACAAGDAGELARLLELPPPDVTLGAAPHPRVARAAATLERFAETLAEARPRLIVVAGEDDASLVCAVTAAAAGHAVARVDAGLPRTESAPTEAVRRRIIDHASTLLFASTRSAVEILAREGLDRRRIFFVGNTLVDGLMCLREPARERRIPERFGLEPRRYIVAAVDERPGSAAADPLLLPALREVARAVPVVVPLTRTRSPENGAPVRELREVGGLVITPDLGYVELLGLLSDAGLVVTDSATVREQTVAVGTACLGLGEAAAMDTGAADSSTVATSRLVETALALFAARATAPPSPELWDGRAGERVVERLSDELVEELGEASTADFAGRS